MIVDESGRYLLRQLNSTTLWRYDRRWRRTQQLSPFAGAEFSCVEGKARVLLARTVEGRLVTSVHGAVEPGTALASGVYENGKWTFTGDNQAWAHVPEYTFLSSDDAKRALLRIGDGAEPDPLEDVDGVTSVIDVPESRLVVLAGGGRITVYDPHSRHAGFRLSLPSASTAKSDPRLRFRDGGKELWLNDFSSLLKLETRNWTVVDAAGFVADAEQQSSPLINEWTFTSDESAAVVCRSDQHSVGVVDTETLELITEISCNSEPVDAVLIDERVVATDNLGKVLRGRARR